MRHDGADVGVVDDVEAGVGNDVLVIRNGNAVHRLPMARDYVTAVDVAGGTVTVTPWTEEDGVMRFHVLTIFPEVFPGPARHRCGRASDRRG